MTGGGVPESIVPKADGSWRPVPNLKPLNRFVISPYFKMESVRSVKNLVQPGDWLIKLDLKDAYLAVPIAPQHYHFLQFQWQGVRWQFKVLPFGLSSAPYTFTKIMKPVVACLRRLGGQIHPLSGRHAASGPVRGKITATPDINSEAPSVAGVPSEPEECAVPYKEIRIPGGS